MPANGAGKKAELDEQISTLVDALADAPDVPAEDLKSFMVWAKSIREKHMSK